MKLHFLLFLFADSIAALAQSKSVPAKVTLLRVEASAFGDEQKFTVTQDSVIVEKRMITDSGDERNHFARAITSSERKDLFLSFDNVYLSTFKASYEANDAPTDDMAFNLFIHKGESVKQISIYRYKLTPFYTFSKKLNRLLPISFRIEYTDDYFSN